MKRQSKIHDCLNVRLKWDVTLVRLSRDEVLHVWLTPASCIRFATKHLHFSARCLYINSFYFFDKTLGREKSREKILAARCDVEEFLLRDLGSLMLTNSSRQYQGESALD